MRRRPSIRRASLYHLLARTLRDQDRVADALVQARRAVKSDPAFAPGVAQAGELALQANRRRLALQLLEEGWRSEPHPDIARVYAQIDPAELGEPAAQADRSPGWCP